MNWVLTTLQWYFFLLILGLIFYPITAKILSQFFDKGYPFAKTIAIIFLSFVIFVFSLLKVLPFSQPSLFLLIILFLIVLILFFIRQKSNIYHLRSKIFNLLPCLLFEELLFLVSLLFLAYVRGQEPSIRGLEKFMDFGFINSILRTKFFPPVDIWYPPEPINYYYFGHLTGAFLIKLTNVKPAIGYNLILATIFAQGITLAFSLVGNLVYLYQKLILKIKEINLSSIIFYGLIGGLVVNLTGNLHTIYLFTTGYPNDGPLPFWQIMSSYNPSRYWYPNATRFIPLTIHEFPSYSYVVADLHGHVFDIPFVLLTLAILFKLFITLTENRNSNLKSNQKSKARLPSPMDQAILTPNSYLLTTIFLGFMCAVHYMTNAFDGPIYILLIMFVFLVLYRLSYRFLINSGLLLLSFVIFSLPFSLNFHPFVSGIGVNCSPDFLVTIKRFGPFLFEKGNCQISPFWMLFILWGFFWINFGLFLITQHLQTASATNKSSFNNPINHFIFTLFSFSSFLLVIPEFFYIKDIYPAHFRANTMFKLGYQAFIIMSIASVFTFFQISQLSNIKAKITLKIVFSFFFFFIFIYSYYAFTSYYGRLNRPVELDGTKWLALSYPEDKEIIDYLNKNIEQEQQPVILEAQGDSYTDYERISANTGLPTVAGWWVHEWLWRGSSDMVGKRIPDITSLYESTDLQYTQQLINKYNIGYVIISKMEKEKYKNLNEQKFNQIGEKIFQTSNGNGAIYQTN